jgi:hypothetical protein
MNILIEMCLKAKSRNRINEIMLALNGSLDEKQCRFLKMLLTHFQDLQDNLSEHAFLSGRCCYHQKQPRHQ